MSSISYKDLVFGTPYIAILKENNTKRIPFIFKELGKRIKIMTTQPYVTSIIKWCVEGEIKRTDQYNQSRFVHFDDSYYFVSI